MREYWGNNKMDIKSCNKCGKLNGIDKVKVYNQDIKKDNYNRKRNHPWRIEFDLCKKCRINLINFINKKY